MEIELQIYEAVIIKNCAALAKLRKYFIVINIKTEKDTRKELKKFCV